MYSFIKPLCFPGEECGTKFYFNANVGQIQFPSNYSANYTSNTLCEWTIELEQESSVVRAYFEDLDIEGDKKCFNDRVVFHDGRDSSAPELGRACGRKIFTDFKSTSRFLTVVFLADNTIGGKGFKVSWTLSQGLAKRKN